MVWGMAMIIIYLYACIFTSSKNGTKLVSICVSEALL